MKNFKRVISLVLVMAMLASFAGMTGYEYSPVAIDAEAASSLTPKQLTGYSAATSSKPKDSFANTNVATISFPPTLYYNGSGEIVNTVGSATMDESLTRINFSFPSNTKSAKITFIKKSTGGHISDSYKDVALNLSLGYYDLLGKNTSLSEGGYFYYKIDYVVNNSNDYISARDITYTQFGASCLLPVPTRYIQAFFSWTKSEGNWSRVHLTHLYNSVDYSPFAASGYPIDLFNTNYRDGDSTDSGYFPNAAGDTMNNSYVEQIWSNYNSTTMFSYRYAPGSQKDEADTIWIAGRGKGNNSSRTAQGATIYVDPYYNNGSQTVTLPTASAHTISEESSKCNYYFRANQGDHADHAFVQESLYDTDNDYAWWNKEKISSGKNTDLGYYNYSNNWYGGMTNSKTTSCADSNFTLTNKAIYSGLNYSLYNKSVTRCSECDSSKDENHVYWKFVFNFVNSNRVNSHTMTEDALENNYVELEMDSKWWANYRTSVLTAYENIGDLKDTSGTADTVDRSYIDFPVYAGVNLSEAYAADGLLQRINYDMGNWNAYAHNSAYISNTYALNDQDGLVVDGKTYNIKAADKKLYSCYGTAVSENWFGWESYNYSKKTVTDESGNSTEVNLNVISATLSSDSMDTLDGYFYTDDSWANYAAKKAALMSYCNTTSSSWLPTISATWSGGNDIYGPILHYGELSIGSDKPKMLYCYNQEGVDTAVSEFKTARAGLTLKAADYYDVIENAVKAATGQNKIWLDSNNGAYDTIDFAIPTTQTYDDDGMASVKNYYEGEYYDYNGKLYTGDDSLTGGKPFDQLNFTSASREALQVALRNRLAYYDFATDGYSSQEDRFSFANTNTQHAHYHSLPGTYTVGTKEYTLYVVSTEPRLYYYSQNADGTVANSPSYYQIDSQMAKPFINAEYAAGLEKKLETGDYFKLNKSYQYWGHPLQDAANDILKAYQGLKLNVWAKALAQELDETITINDGETSAEFKNDYTYRIDLQNAKNIYTAESWERYEYALNYAAMVLKSTKDTDFNRYTTNVMQGDTAYDSAAEYHAAELPILGTVDEAALFNASQPVTITLNGKARTLKTEGFANKQLEYNWVLTEIRAAEAALVHRTPLNGTTLAQTLDKVLYSETDLPGVDGTYTFAINNGGGFTGESANAWTYYVSLVDYAVKILNGSKEVNHNKSLVEGQAYAKGTYTTNFSKQLAQDDKPVWYDDTALYYSSTHAFTTTDENGDNVTKYFAATADKPNARYEEYKWVNDELIRVAALLGIKTLADYEDTTHGYGKGYESIKEKMTAEINALKAKNYTYYELDGSELKEVTVYPYSATAELEAQLDAILALYTSVKDTDGSDLSDEKAYYQNAEKLTTAIASYSTDYQAQLNKKFAVNDDAWNAIVTKLSENIGVTLNGSNLVTELGKVYDGFDIAAEGETQTYREKLQAIVNRYIAAAANKDDALANGNAKQNTMNAVIKDFRDALNVTKKATDALSKAKAVIADANSDGNKVDVYDYAHDSANKAVANAKVSKYTVDSLAQLESKANEKAAEEYNILTDGKTKINAAVAVIDGYNALVSEGGVLVKAEAETEYLEKAKAYAEKLLAEKKLTIANPDKGENTPEAAEDDVQHEKYTAQSVAELEYVINEAADLLTALNEGTVENSMDNQLSVDKLTFALYEEADDSLTYMLPTEIDNQYRYWIYDSTTGKVTPDTSGSPSGWEIKDATFKSKLYSAEERARDNNGKDLGLKYGPAYYGFLDQEINHVNASFASTNEAEALAWVIDADGNIVKFVTDAAGKEAGASLFTGWEAYKTAYTNSVNFNKTYDVANQGLVNEQAAKMHAAFMAMVPLNFSANKEYFDIACGYADKFEAIISTNLKIKRYNVNADKGGYTTSESAVSMYLNVDADFVAAVELFRAEFASTSTSKPYDSVAAMNEAYEALNAKITEKGIAPRTMADEEIRAGVGDLTANFIAGTWNGTTYETTLLNDTQKAEVQELLEAIERTKDSEEELSVAVGLLNAANDALLNYVVNTTATDLQFAVTMKNNLFNFYGMNIPATNLLQYYAAYYYGSARPTTPMYIFNQNMVKAAVYDEVDEYFAYNDNWPKIYQVNGITYNSTTGEIQDFEYTNGNYERTSGDATVIDGLLKSLFVQVSPHAIYYSQAFGYANKYNLDSLTWINQNAMLTTDDGQKYVIADPAAAGGYPKQYFPRWAMQQQPSTYKTGTGVEIDGKRYYPYELTNEKDENYNKYSSTGGWFTGSIQLSGVYGPLQQYLGLTYGTDFTKYYEALSSSSIFGDWAKKMTHYQTLNEIVASGWSPSAQNNIIGMVTQIQVRIEQSAQAYYQQIYNLQLLPATDAYRKVARVYFSVMGQQPVYSSTDTHTVHLITASDSRLTDLDGGGVFYQSEGDPFFDTLYSITQVPTSSYSKDTFSGLITGSSEILPDRYNQGEDTNWLALNSYYSTLYSGTKFTIDQKDKVIGSADDSVIKKLYGYIDALTLREDNFDDLNTLVAAFLANQETTGGKVGSIQGLESAFKSKYGLNKTYYYAYNYYTEDSLAKVAAWLGTENNVISTDVSEQIYTLNNLNPELNSSFTFNFPYTPNSHKGSFYTSTSYKGLTGQEAIDQLVTDFAAKINELELKPVDTTELDAQIAKAVKILEKQDIYDKVSTEGEAAWNDFLAKKKAAEDKKNEQGLTLAEHQQDVDKAWKELSQAIEALKLIADETAPELNVLTGAKDIENFYKEHETQLKTADKNYSTATAATFVMPGGSGNSLMVYTNQLNPRVVLNLQDFHRYLAETNDQLFIEATKHEQITISASRTSGVIPNVISGQMENDNDGNYIKSISTKNVANNGDGTLSLPNESTAYDTSLFAVLAPEFVDDGTVKQAALYTIQASDFNGNQTNSLVISGGSSEAIKTETKITIYIYYMNTMAADGSQAGIADGVLTGGPVVYTDNELSDKWNSGVMLLRSFNGPKNWEFVSPIVGNKVEDVTGVPVYNDPDFGNLNTGSFAYILNSAAAANTLDGKVFADYHAAKKTENDEMDYAAAIAATETIKTAINANADVFNAMKESGRYIEYGRYANWTQVVGSAYPNGTLIFIHVVDRWGNVCNRVLEIVRVDGSTPSVTSSGTGAATVVEQGGSGITYIDVWDYLSTESDPKTAGGFTNSRNQSVTVDSAFGGRGTTIDVSDNKVTVSNLVPGYGYHVGATDGSGRTGREKVRADADGNIVIEITDNGDVDSVQKTQAPAEVSTMSFVMNGFALVQLNSLKASSVIDAEVVGNVLANNNKKAYHYIETESNVIGLKIENVLTGAVDEWTSSNASITDNGDGTSTWRVYRTLAQGEHKFKVTAKTDLGYEEVSVPFTITATTKTVKLTQNVLGLGYVKVQYSGSRIEKIPAYTTLTIPYGAEVTLSACVNKADREFKYWVNDSTKRIISMDAELNFKAVANTDYVAQFTTTSSYDEGKKVVIYTNYAGNILNTYEISEGEKYAIPAAPQLPDYEFERWSMSQAEVLASDSDMVIVRPVYSLSLSNTVTLTQGNYTVTGAGKYSAAEAERAIANINASATNDAGESFLYWYDEEAQAIASYSRMYSFYVLRDITLTPVYGEPNSPAQPVIRIADVRYDADTKKVTFYAERSIPAEYTILQTGIVITKTAEIAADEEAFVLNGTGTAAGTSTSTASSGYYSAAASALSGVSVWARGYAICETASGDIVYVYSPVASYSVK